MKKARKKIHRGQRGTKSAEVINQVRKQNEKSFHAAPIICLVREHINVHVKKRVNILYIWFDVLT